MQMIVRTAPGLTGSSFTPREEAGNVVYSTRAQVEDYVLAGQRMALLCAWNGRQEVSLEGRRLVVDDDTWLLVPNGVASVRVRGGEGIQALTILFRNGMPEEVLGSLVTAEDRLLESGEVEYETQLPFLPNLQMHDRSVTPVLMFISRHRDAGIEDPLWYEEQLTFLLERMLARHRQVIGKLRSMPVRRAATRREIFRRVSLATDFIHSNYEKPLMLTDMARAAFLSRHHFLRLFKNVHEVTPHEYLQRKRTSVAARLLRGSALAVEEIVKQVGFDSRSTLFRAMRRFHGVTPRECRQTSTALVSMSAAMAEAEA
jgi:AraC family transcriptional regulator